MYLFSHCKYSLYSLALLGAKVVASCCDIEVSSLGSLGSLGASRTRHWPRPFKSSKVLVESLSNSRKLTRLRSLAWGPEAWHRSGRRWMKGSICRLSTSNRRNLLETIWIICIWKIWKFILNYIDNDIQFSIHIDFATSHLHSVRTSLGCFSDVHTEGGSRTPQRQPPRGREAWLPQKKQLGMPQVELMVADGDIMSTYVNHKHVRNQCYKPMLPIINRSSSCVDNVCLWYFRQEPDPATAADRLALQVGYQRLSATHPNPKRGRPGRLRVSQLTADPMDFCQATEERVAEGEDWKIEKLKIYKMV